MHYVLLLGLLFFDDGGVGIGTTCSEIPSSFINALFSTGIVFNFCSFGNEGSMACISLLQSVQPMVPLRNGFRYVRVSLPFQLVYKYVNRGKKNSSSDSAKETRVVSVS